MAKALAVAMCGGCGTTGGGRAGHTAGLPSRYVRDGRSLCRACYGEWQEKRSLPTKDEMDNVKAEIDAKRLTRWERGGPTATGDGPAPAYRPRIYPHPRPEWKR